MQPRSGCHSSLNLRRLVAQTLHHVLEELVEGDFPFSVFLDERQRVPPVRLIILNLERGGLAGYLLIARLWHLLGLIILVDLFQHFVGRFVLFLGELVEHVQRAFRQRLLYARNVLLLRSFIKSFEGGSRCRTAKQTTSRHRENDGECGGQSVNPAGIHLEVSFFSGMFTSFGPLIYLYLLRRALDVHGGQCPNLKFSAP